MLVTVIHKNPKKRFQIDIPESELENKTVDEIHVIINNHVLQHVDENLEASWELRNHRVHGVGSVKK